MPQILFFLKEQLTWIKWDIEYTSQFEGSYQPYFSPSFEGCQCMLFYKLLCKCIPKILLGLYLAQILVRLKNIYKAKQNIMQWPQTAYSLFIPSLLQWVLKVSQWKLCLCMHVCIKFYKNYTEIIVWFLKINADRFRNKGDIFMLLTLPSL